MDVRRAASRPLAVALLLAGLVLALTADERVFGLGTDGRIMLRTALSMARLGEIGVARGEAVNVPRAGGDAVSLYGMGESLVLAVPMLAAGSLEKTFGAGASQSLLVLSQIVCVLLASLAAGLLALSWGASERAAAGAAVATALASPLWAYVALDFSEPLQAALAGGAFAAAGWAAGGDARARKTLALAALAGFFAGFALLTKSLLVVLFPAVLAALLLPARGGRGGRLAAACAGFAPPSILWLAFEIVRFGRPFGSYGGMHFNHPLFDGLWRLTVGPNKGLVLYFPLSVLSLWGAARLLRERRVEAAAALGFLGVLLASAAMWWAWDGTFGWGPRLLASGLPILAALAACASAPRSLFRALFAVGLAVNGLAALQPESLTSWTYKVLPRRELSAAEAARFPPFAFERRSDGRLLLFNQYEAANHAALAEIPLAARLLAARLEGRGVAALDAALWKSNDPALRPVSSLAEAVAGAELVHLTAPFRWPRLGMSFSRRKGQADQSLAYVEALLDQANRAQDMGRPDRALAFGEELFALHPNPETAVVLAEGYRLAGRRETLAAFAQEILRKKTVDPDFGVVLSLAARDAGDAEGARKVLEDVSGHVSSPDVEWLLTRPPADWPSTLREVRRARQASPSPFRLG